MTQTRSRNSDDIDVDTVTNFDVDHYISVSFDGKKAVNYLVRRIIIEVDQAEIEVITFMRRSGSLKVGPSAFVLLERMCSLIVYDLHCDETSLTN